ncbi:MAG: MotA/TolQ/ExbB proton channel family protein, partial [Verrucomicrobia bacterium]
YAFFRGRVQRLISDLESAVTHLLALLSVRHGEKGLERTPVLLEEDF